MVEQDLDISRRSFARAGIQKLMEMMRSGAITTIVTYRYDRFGRNLQQALAHLEEVEQLGGQVVSVTEPIDATTAIAVSRCWLGRHALPTTPPRSELHARVASCMPVANHQVIRHSGRVTSAP